MSRKYSIYLLDLRKKRQELEECDKQPFCNSNNNGL